MSDRPIQVGDLALVVKPSYCCKKAWALGKPVKVLSLHFFNSYHCVACGAIHHSEVLAGCSDGNNREVSRLRRIPPLSELEGVETEEGVKV